MVIVTYQMVQNQSLFRNLHRRVEASTITAELEDVEKNGRGKSL